MLASLFILFSSFAQVYPKDGLYSVIYDHFDACGISFPPILTITGDSHPKNSYFREDLRNEGKVNEKYLTNAYNQVLLRCVCCTGSSESRQRLLLC